MTSRSRRPAANADAGPGRSCRAELRGRRRSVPTAARTRPSSGTASTATSDRQLGRRTALAGQPAPRPADRLTVPDGYRVQVGLTVAIVGPTRAIAQADIAEMARRYHADEPDEAERARSATASPASSGSRFRLRPARHEHRGRTCDHERSAPSSGPRPATGRGFREAALEAEAAGWDSVWTWDHLLAIQGPWRQPIFEGWTVAGAWAALTTRIRLGLMVGANTFRNPGLTAKLATTLDHISDGRAILGHRRRLVRARARRLRDRLRGGLRRAPRPARRGGRAHPPAARRRDGRPRRAGLHDPTTRAARRGRSRPTCRSWSAAPGPKKTLRTVARHGDAWNTDGTLEAVTARDWRSCAAHCADVGRDPATIERTVSFPMVIRDDRGRRRGAPSTRSSPQTGSRRHRRA